MPTSPSSVIPSDWKTPAALIALSVVPSIAGIIRLSELSNGASLTLENSRFHAAPLPITLHVVAATLFCILGALQFSSSFRRRQPRWHRISGRVLVPCGLLASISGLWMTLFYPISPQLQGLLLYVVRLVVGTAMLTAIVLAVVAIRRGEFGMHRAWMIRGYALGQGAGTQVLIFMAWALVTSDAMPTALTRDLLMSLAWLINLAVAERIIRRPHYSTNL